jgi:hypothetical protein
MKMLMKKPNPELQAYKEQLRIENLNRKFAQLGVIETPKETVTAGRSQEEEKEF